jgi:hypothetical protein
MFAPGVHHEHVVHRHAGDGVDTFRLEVTAFSTNPGRCLASQVGVNAPGTENNTTVLPFEERVAREVRRTILCHHLESAAGNLSPTLIDILILQFVLNQFIAAALVAGENAGLHEHCRAPRD